jgi:hypothetical protein
MTAKGTCHCGALQFELETAPESVTECNCTYCAKVGALWAYYQPGQVRLTRNDSDGAYEPRMNVHHFCSHCGCTVYTATPTWDPVTHQPDFSRPQWSVNARLLEDFDLSTVEHKSIDGRNMW